jgi:hypothetical protein
MERAMVEAVLNSGYDWRIDPDKLEAVIAKASVDTEFHHLLLHEHETAFKKMGIDLPEDIRIVVHEFSLDERHIFLPPLAESAVAAEAATDNRPFPERPAQFTDQRPHVPGMRSPRFVRPAGNPR